MQSTTEELIRWLIDLELDDETIVWVMEDDVSEKSRYLRRKNNPTS